MKKRAKIIIILFIVLTIVSVFLVFYIKYKAGQRYLQYEELEPTQIVLVYENIGEYVDENGTEVKVNIRAIDAEGNLYSVYVPYEGWNGIETFFDEILNGEKTVNCIYDEDMIAIYNSILLLDENEELKPSRNNGSHTLIYPIPFSQSYYYGIRYKANNEWEHVKIWEERSFEEYYFIDNPASENIIEKIIYLL